MKLEIILLGTLRAQPSSGYELTRFLDNAGRFMRSNTTMSQVYRTLTSMETRGLVTHSVESRPGASDVKRFAITEEGEAALMDWLNGPYNPPSRFQDPDLFARLSFGGLIGRDRVIEILDIEISTRLAEIARYRAPDRSAPLTSYLREGDDLEFGLAIAHWMSDHARSAMDQHVEALVTLRERLLDGLPAADVDAAVRDVAYRKVSR
jgi:DNA-binding PadR family transcriptional regulator